MCTQIALSTKVEKLFLRVVFFWSAVVFRADRGLTVRDLVVLYLDYLQVDYGFQDFCSEYDS